MHEHGTKLGDVAVKSAMGNIIFSFPCIASQFSNNFLPLSFLCGVRYKTVFKCARS